VDMLLLVDRGDRCVAVARRLVVDQGDRCVAVARRLVDSIKGIDGSGVGGDERLVAFRGVGASCCRSRGSMRCGRSRGSMRRGGAASLLLFGDAIRRGVPIGRW
jgi:hypothetical protein